MPISDHLNKDFQNCPGVKSSQVYFHYTHFPTMPLEVKRCKPSMNPLLFLMHRREFNRHWAPSPLTAPHPGHIGQNARLVRAANKHLLLDLCL